jgi:hypothetical protein
MAEPVFGTSADMSSWMFLESSFDLLAEGLIIGLGCGVLIAVGERWIPRWANYDGHDLP